MGKNDGSKMKKTRCAAICFCASGFEQKRDKENAQRMAGLSVLKVMCPAFFKVDDEQRSVVRTATYLRGSAKDGEHLIAEAVRLM